MHSHTPISTVQRQRPERAMPSPSMLRSSSSSQLRWVWRCQTPPLSLRAGSCPYGTTSLSRCAVMAIPTAPAGVAAASSRRSASASAALSRAHIPSSSLLAAPLCSSVTPLSCGGCGGSAVRTPKAYAAATTMRMAVFQPGSTLLKGVLLLRGDGGDGGRRHMSASRPMTGLRAIASASTTLIPFVGLTAASPLAHAIRCASMYCGRSGVSTVAPSHETSMQSYATTAKHNSGHDATETDDGETVQTTFGLAQHGGRSASSTTSSRPPSTASRNAPAKVAAARGGGGEKVSGAILAASIMRRHRLHASLHYLSISSGVEVPECAGGAYHLQERPPLRHSTVAVSAAAGRGDHGSYLGRSRTCASNVRVSVFPSVLLRPASGTDSVSSSCVSSPDRRPSSSPSSATATRASPSVLRHDAAHLRIQQYEPFNRLLHRYIERGHVAYATQRLLHHPNAPAPAVLLDMILRHRVPAASFVCQALLATMHTTRRDRSTAAAAGFALDRVAVRLRNDEKARVLYQTPQVRALLLEATLQESLFDTAVDVVTDMPVEWITPHAWSQLVVMAGQSKLPHSHLLWKLLRLREGSLSTLRSSSRETRASAQPVLTRAGESALLGALRQRPLSTAPSAVHLSHMAATVDASALEAPELDAIAVPDGVLDPRACATVLAPAKSEVGGALLTDSTVAGEALPIDEEGEESAQLASETNEGQSPATPVMALVPTGTVAGGDNGIRWCALGAVELGYAAEHYNGDASPAAGDFRASGAAGTLYSHSSFQALLADVEREGVQAGGSAEASPAVRARALWETTALRMINSRHGIAYGLDATMTAQVLLRCGVSFAAQASPLLALHVLRRYLHSCRLLRDQVVAAQHLVEAQLSAVDERSTGRIPRAATTPTTTAIENQTRSRHHSERASSDLYPRLSRTVMPHPAPFLVFFKVMREARDVLLHAVYGSDEEGEEVATLSATQRYRGTAAAAAGRAHASLPMVHWELVWHVFQQLNRENPLWYTQLGPQEAGDLCIDAMEVLCHGADPWLTLNVARRVSARHIIDGVDMSLWLLNRLDPSHHTDEAREVARKLFRWLLVDVGVHVQPPLHRHLVPAARTLIRLGLQEELSTLYNAVIDNVVLFTPEHRDAFLHVLRDLICPACASVLPEGDVYVDRVCPNCMEVVPAKDTDTIPSFRLSAEHVERQRAQRKQRRQRTRQRLSASVRRLQQDGARGSGSSVSLFHPPRDAADILRWHLQKRDSTEQGGEDGALDISPSSSLLLAASAAAGAPLVPGVSVSNELALFPVAGEGASGAQVLDVRAAMEESSRRLELQRAARRYVLAQRGVCDDADGGDGGYAGSSGGVPSATLRVTYGTLPTTLPVSAQALDASTLKYLSTAAKATPGSEQAVDGAWVCVWCQENNTEWCSRVQCSACRAETGPGAPWRRFAYTEASGDIMLELRGRISNCEERPVDAIVAGYLLMVYRRIFQLRATPADQDRLLRLVEVLCQLQERVLAAYVYTRLIPISQRRLGMPLSSLAQIFGQEMSPTYQALRQEDLTRPGADGMFFEAIFGAQTCRICFGQHDWHLCPIVTRNFAASESATGEDRVRTAISLSPEEKQRAVLERLSQRIRHAATSLSPSDEELESATSSSPSSPSVLLPPGKPCVRLVVDAYTAFVSSPFREIFAELHSSDANCLSLLLSRVQQYRRAAFVLCHVPPPQRAMEAYLRMVHYFNVTEAEALALLEPPPAPATASKGPAASGCSSAGYPASVVRHVNFMQVTQTCCMCLDARHASHTCPRLDEWLKRVQRLALSGSSGSNGAAGAPSSAAATTLVDIQGDARLRRRLKAQVDGWTTAGPERLHAFYRYLIVHIDLLRPMALMSAGTAKPSALRRADFDDPLVYAVNKTIVKLSAVERRSETYRLYSHAPVECVSVATTAAVLRMNGFSEESAQTLLTHASSTEEGPATRSGSDTFAGSRCSSVLLHASLAARTAAVPVRQCCLLCFSPDHAFVECLELSAASTEVERLLIVLRNVAEIACVPDGIGAAAAYVYSEYNRGRLSAEMMRSHPELVRELLMLTRRCFATRQLSHGVRVLRRIPVEMVPPDTAYVDLWRAAGLPADEVEQKRVQLLALLDAEAVQPSLDPLPPRRTYTNAFLSQLSRTLHDDLCRHCYEHGHTIATCPLFHAEVSFGRDYVAAYRMSMMSEQLDRAWQEAYLLKLVDFFATHFLFMPFHIAGVANALNAITSMWSFRGEPGIALRHLLRIPPAYRRRQAFKHVLHSLRVPPAEITKLLSDFYFAPDGNATAAQQQQQKGSISPSTSGYHAQQQQEVVMAQHLLLPKPAIRDVARKQIFDQVPAAVAALEESEERMAEIRAHHERQGGSGGGITAEVQERLSQQQREQPGRCSTEMSHTSSPHAAASFHSPVLRRIMQSGDITQLREDFDPILTELEDAVGMKLGSRHTLFTSTAEIFSTAAATAASAPPSPPSSFSSSTPSSSSSGKGSGTRMTASGAAPSSPTFPQTPEAEVVEVQTHYAPTRFPSSRQSTTTRVSTTSSADATAGVAPFSERTEQQVREGDISKPVGASRGSSSSDSGGDGRSDCRDARGSRSNRDRNPRHRSTSQWSSHAYNRDRDGRSRKHDKNRHHNRSS